MEQAEPRPGAPEQGAAASDVRLQLESIGASCVNAQRACPHDPEQFLRIVHDFERLVIGRFFLEKLLSGAIRSCRVLAAGGNPD